jgi:PKD repeat protein
VDSVDAQTVVQILATPGGTDYSNAVSRSVSIRLVPPGIILPPNGTPVPAFSYSPSAPLARSDVIFDASLSTDSDGRIVSYAWNFGDGSQGSGALVRHEFSNDGSHTVTLTVTDDRGQSASLSKPVVVTASANPVARFDFSPQPPLMVGQKVFFNAAKSTAATGRTIVRYDWDYGSGRQGSGIQVSQIYSQPGNFVVTLTVTDDAGNKGTDSTTVTVGAGGLAASFSYLPTAPTSTDTVFFNGSASTSTNGIASYSWTFGDGSSDTGVTPSHSFLSSCTGLLDKIFVVSLTVKDTKGATATIAKEVKVTNCR